MFWSCACSVCDQPLTVWCWSERVGVGLDAHGDINCQSPPRWFACFHSFNGLFLRQQAGTRIICRFNNEQKRACPRLSRKTPEPLTIDVSLDQQLQALRALQDGRDWILQICNAWKHPVRTHCHCFKPLNHRARIKDG